MGAVVLFEAKYAENSQTTQYTSTNVITTIDKLTVTNVSASNATITINIVVSGGSASAANKLVSTRTLAPGEEYTAPSIVGHNLSPGDFISTLAGTANALVIRGSGRQYTN